MRDRRRPYDELARALIRPERPQISMVGSTTAGGVDEATKVNTLPLPLGSVGDVLTVVTDGTDTVPAWSPSGVGGGQYRQYVLVSDGAGGFDFVDDGAGNPVESLENLE